MRKHDTKRYCYRTDILHIWVWVPICEILRLTFTKSKQYFPSYIPLENVSPNTQNTILFANALNNYKNTTFLKCCDLFRVEH